MKLTKTRAIKAVAGVLGWRARPAAVRVEGLPEAPVFIMPVGKMLVEVGTAQSLAPIRVDEKPEKYGLRTIIYIELRLPSLPYEWLCTRFFFLDTLEEAEMRGEYHRTMDAIDACEGFSCFDADAARTIVLRTTRHYAAKEESQPPRPVRPQEAGADAGADAAAPVLAPAT